MSTRPKLIPEKPLASDGALVDFSVDDRFRGSGKVSMSV